MADRVSASIVIGGTIAATDYAELAGVIADEGLSTEWDGEAFAPDDRTIGEPLSLYAHEVAWGRFETLEAWCVEKDLPLARWSGAYGGEWSAERVVLTGQGQPSSYTADEDDRVMVDRQIVERLGSLSAIIAYFEAADFAVPPLVVEGEPGELPAPPTSEDRLPGTTSDGALTLDHAPPSPLPRATGA